MASDRTDTGRQSLHNKTFTVFAVCIMDSLTSLKAAYSVTMNIFRKILIFFLNHL